MGLVWSNYQMKAHVTGVAHSFFQSHNIKTVTMKSKEIFKDIPGYEGVYQVSNLGNVKSLNREIILKEQYTKGGYAFVNLSKNGIVKIIYIHQLVAMAFLNHKPNGINLVVNHINFNKLDNKLDNLEIITQRENTNKKHLKSTSKYVGVSLNKRDMNWRATIRINGKKTHLGMFKNEYDAHLAYQGIIDTFSKLIELRRK
jgi:hypothetical protein